MKYCPSCATEKPLEDFGIHNARKDGRQSECSLCKRLRDAASYRKDPDWYRARNARLLRRNQEYVIAHLEAHPCVDCGEGDIIVLEFDHVTEGKLDEVTAMVNRAVSLETLAAEIKKCEVRCANCHRRKTSERGRHYRWLHAQAIGV